jgi:hypothetical protein
MVNNIETALSKFYPHTSGFYTLIQGVNTNAVRTGCFFLANNEL